MADRPEVEQLARRLRDVQRAVLDARPRDPRTTVTGDVQQALFPIVQDELAYVLSDLNPEELATLRWLSNYEPETIARFVVMVQRAHEGGRNHE